MVSRRGFLRNTSLAVGATLGLGSLAHSEVGEEALPPAIAALQTRRGEAKPITLEERTGRQEKARSLMRENNLSAIFLAPGTSLRYFTGIHWEGGERLFAMVLPAKGDAFYVAPAFEEGRAREQIAQAPRAVSRTFACGRRTKAPTNELRKDSAIAVSPARPSALRKLESLCSATTCEKLPPASRSAARLR